MSLNEFDEWKQAMKSNRRAHFQNAAGGAAGGGLGCLMLLLIFGIGWLIWAGIIAVLLVDSPAGIQAS